MFLVYYVAIQIYMDSEKQGIDGLEQISTIPVPLSISTPVPLNPKIFNQKFGTYIRYISTVN